MLAARDRNPTAPAVPGLLLEVTAAAAAAAPGGVLAVMLPFLLLLLICPPLTDPGGLSPCKGRLGDPTGDALASVLASRGGWDVPIP